jgi:hypothetical protein
MPQKLPTKANHMFAHPQNPKLTPKSAKTHNAGRLADIS